MSVKENKIPFLIRFQRKERDLLSDLSERLVTSQNEVIIDALLAYEYLTLRDPEIIQFIKQKRSAT